MATIENIAVLPRPRSAWQAMDAGFSLARAHYPTLCLLWLGLSLPTLALWCLLSLKFPYWAAIVWWWFKPLYELPLLLYLSRALFSEKPTLRETWRAVRQHLGRLCRTYLTITRLSPARSMTASVVFLEKLPRAERRARIDILTAVPTRSYLLMIVCLHIEVVLAYGLVALLVIMVPSLSSDTDWSAILLGEGGEQDPPWLAMVSNIAFWLVSALVAPFYVAGGFLIYINRRMQLEGWDIEHRFRAIRSEQRSSAATSKAVSVLAVLILTIIVTGSPTAVAQSGDDLPSRIDVRAQIAHIHAGDEFGETKTRRVLRLKESIKEQDDSEESAYFNKFVSLLVTLSQMLEVFFWIIAGVGVVLIGFAVYHFLPNSRLRSLDLISMRTTPEATTHALTAELPTDIAAAASARLASGDRRGAVSLLYRGALRALMMQHQVSVPDSATEADCVRLLAIDASPAQTDAFGELVSRWQNLAYAQGSLDDAVIRELIVRWTNVFNASSARATEA